MREAAPLHPVNRGHLEALTDAVGILQHASGSRPDPAHGYCVDDVARAVQVDLLHARGLGWAVVADDMWRGLRFLDAAFDADSGRFRNFRAADGTWADAPGSEDCHGRAMLALGETIASAIDPAVVTSARALFERGLPAAGLLTALRARSSVVLACAAVLGAGRHTATEAVLRSGAERLAAEFLAADASDWPWPEPFLTYENGLPVRAVLAAGGHLGSRSAMDAGLRALDWLIVVQTAQDGGLSPVGNGWWQRGGEKSRFDQQPIEATALVLATEAAFRLTGDGRYLDAMERAYAWFLGANDLGVAIADPGRGASFDGLTPLGVNANQGAESTLMWLTALEHIRAVRQRWPATPTAAPRATTAPAGLR